MLYYTKLLNPITFLLCILTLIQSSHLKSFQNQIEQTIRSDNNSKILNNNYIRHTTRQLQQQINSNLFIQPSILSFLQMYKTRSNFCIYQCKNINIFSQIICFLNYMCYSQAISDIQIILGIFLYVFLPATLFILGIWSTRCFGRYLSTFIGLRLCYKIFQHYEQKIQDDAITNSQNTSQSSGNSGLTEKNQDKTSKQ